MGSPSVPGADDTTLELPCGEVIDRESLDLGLRQLPCPCGSDHAVVMDVHPLSRWIPETVEAVLAETIEPADEYDEFATIHLMALVREEYPDSIVVMDDSENPDVGWALGWITEFDAPELHRVIVELLVEVMDHAVGHTDDDSVESEFAEKLAEFDVEEFVTAYRKSRGFDDEFDTAV